MKQYNVELTMIHNLTLTIEAESSEAAIRYVEENREELAPAESFHLRRNNYRLCGCNRIGLII